MARTIKDRKPKPNPLWQTPFNERTQKPAQVLTPTLSMRIGDYTVIQLGDGKVYLSNKVGEGAQIEQWKLELAIASVFKKEF